MRGVIARKLDSLRQKRNMTYIRPTAKMISYSKIPNYTNEKTREAEANIGEFNYNIDTANYPSYRDVMKRPPFQLDNTAVYIGEWNKDGLRQGKGI